MQITFETGDTLVFDTDSDWKTHDTEQDGWYARNFDDADWVSAMEIAPYGEGL